MRFTLTPEADDGTASDSPAVELAFKLREVRSGVCDLEWYDKSADDTVSALASSLYCVWLLQLDPEAVTRG